MMGLILLSKSAVDDQLALAAEGLKKIRRMEKLLVPSKGIGVDRFRNWLRTTYFSGQSDELLVHWIKGADNLSEVCQNILLKPLEEAGENVLFVLEVKSELRLLATIRSRCRVRKSALTRTVPVKGAVWEELVRAWKAGPSKSVSLIDKWAGKDVGVLLEFFIVKLAKGLREFPSLKKIEVLKLCLILKEDLKLMVNPRLVLGRFLLEGGSIASLDD